MRTMMIGNRRDQAAPPQCPLAAKVGMGILAVAFALGLAGCSSREPGLFQGYLEGEFVYVASPLGGTLTNLAVHRGSEVRAAELLFELESEPEVAAAREAEERLAQARARLANLNKGRRPTEIAALEAQLARTKANLRLSELELERRNQLIANQVISAAELDVARARRDADQAQVDLLTAEIETARLGARVDEIKAGEADVEAAAALVTQARWALKQKRQFAPANAWVHDTLYRPGEWVGPGRPVVSLLPPENIKVRFFVPEEEVGGIRVGQPVSVNLDGVATSYRATINYISTQAEFTPPVIYSKENRAKLVFMVEASFAPEDARHLRPGQPADVKLNP